MVALAPFGPAVPASVRTLTTKVEMQVENGSTMPFKGPILDQGGKVEIKAGVIPTISMLESTTYLVKGVVGNLPH